MNDFSIEKVQKAADELGIEIEFNSDNPTDFGDFSDIPKLLEEIHAINSKNYFKDIRELTVKNLYDHVISEMNREEKVKYLIDLGVLINSIEFKPEHFNGYSDKELDAEIEYHNFMLGK